MLVSALTKLLKGRLHGGEDVVVTGHSIDTRVLKPREVFYALDGRKTSGVRYLSAAFRAGAAVCVVAERYAAQVPAKGACIFVDDPVSALQRAAAALMASDRCQVVAVTGSCGKTTVKELIAALLAKKYTVSRNKGNLNNHIGLPLSILNAPPAAYYVAEMGASKPGDIAELCAVARPSIGVITNVYPAHLEGFGTLETVYRTKCELAEYVAARKGYLVIDGDDETLVRSVTALPGYAGDTFGYGATVTYRAVTPVYRAGCASFRLQENEWNVPLDAVLNVKNVLAAYAVARYAGVDDADCRETIRSFVPPAGRFTRVMQNGITIIDDCYNANPASFLNALMMFDAFAPAGRRVLVCADMLELGDESDRYHDEIGAAVAAHALALVVAVGDGGARIAERCASLNPACRIVIAPNNRKATETLKTELRRDDTVLFKGSRGMHLEEIIAELKEFPVCC